MGAGELSEPRFKARLAGLCYVLMSPAGGLAMFLRGRLYVKGDAVATAINILAHESWLRLAFAGDLLVVPIYIAFTVLLYDLMKPVNRTVSMLAAFLSLMGCAMQAIACLFELAPLVFLGRDPYLSVFKSEQLQSLAFLSLRMYSHTYGMALVFFGFYNLVIGYLVFKSTFLPRILGVLMAASAPVGLMFLWPPFAAKYFGSLLVLDVGELLLVLWLLVMGVNAERWWEQAGADFSSAYRDTRADGRQNPAPSSPDASGVRDASCLK